MSAAQVRPMSSSPAASSIRSSPSLAAHLGALQHTIPLHARYDNFIGGRWVAPVKGGYFDNFSPTTGQVICQIARSQSEDVELAIDAAHAAAESWGRTAITTSKNEECIGQLQHESAWILLGAIHGAWWKRADRGIARSVRSVDRIGILELTPSHSINKSTRPRPYAYLDLLIF